MMDIRLVGIPVQDGARRCGCEMGPDAFRTAGIVRTLENLGHSVTDIGNISPDSINDIAHRNRSLYRLGSVSGWILRAADIACRQMSAGFPIFMGGDHVMSAGTVSGVMRYAAERKQPLFVLWLDAHSDFHTLDSTTSGNLHGTPVAYFAGLNGFQGYYPPLQHAVPLENICMFGLRSVDSEERTALSATPVTVCDMRTIDQNGIAVLLGRFLEHVRKTGGLLHVSLDVDFLDPSVAPAAGTTVSGGATVREAHLVMEMLHDSGLVTSLDLAELNPFLDERGRTANLMMDLTASLMGRCAVDRIARSF